MLEAKIAKRHTNFLELKAESHIEITATLAEEAQERLGLPSIEHGFAGFELKKCPVLMRYVATWRCLAEPIPY